MIPPSKSLLFPIVYQTCINRSLGTNSYIAFRTQADHFYINFLHTLCHSMKVLTFELEFGCVATTPPIVWAVTNPCTYCSRPIVETPITITSSLIPSIRLRPLRSTRVETTGLKILQDSYQAFTEKGVINDFREEENIITREIAFTGILQELVEESSETHRSLTTLTYLSSPSSH